MGSRSKRREVSTDRVACQTEGCPSTLLPATAARTGGLCMVCVNRRSQAERQEYIRLHRREVDPVAGLCDPVEILVAMHRPRAHDPLIVYKPIPFDREQIFSELNQTQLDQLMEIALQARRAGQRELAEGIGILLATLTTQDLSPLLVSWKEGTPWPAVMFRGAPALVRDSLIQYLEDSPDTALLQQVLCSLAWIGDSVVQQKLASWEQSPPAWRQRLHVTPSDYAQEAGWELRGQVRRDLTYPTCLGVHTGESDGALRAFQSGPADCPWCGRRLVHLLELDLRNRRLEFLPFFGPRLAVLSCDSCTLFAENVFAKVGADGEARWHSQNVRPDSLARDPADWPTSPWQSAALSLSLRMPMQAVESDRLGGSVSQIGGLPKWVQDAHYPKCPDCGQSMHFLAQLDNGDFPSHEGIHYVFLCADCRVTATNYQQS